MKKNDTSEAWSSGLGAGLFFGVAGMALLWFGFNCVGDYNERLGEAQNEAENARRKVETLENWVHLIAPRVGCHYEFSGWATAYGCDPEEKTK